MIHRPAFDAKHAERTMRWLRANGVTEQASEIGAYARFDDADGRIHYEVIRRGWTAQLRRSVPQRVTFSEANREAS